MPPNRSRTLEWRRCLRQILERHGALEIAVSHRNGESTANQHLLWRVRLLDLSETEIIVEQPSALGHLIQIDIGTELIGILSIGQNRWMFTTNNLGGTKAPLPDRKLVPALRLVMPEAVQRCQRRSHYRVETAELNLPLVEMWPLLDPKSVLVAERAYEIQHEIAMGRLREHATATGLKFDYEDVMPEVGPRFTGTLLNLGGGGVGVRVGESDSQALNHHKLFWLRIALPITPPVPVCSSGKLVHTHMESSHDTYAGLAFDFSFNPSHQRFVVDQICRYIALQQRVQHAELEQRRKTA